MRRALILATLATFGGLATGASSWAQKPDKSATLTAAVAPAKVRFGVPAVVSGAISSKQAGIALVLEAQPFPYSGKWTEAGTTTTGADGSYRFPVTPPTNTRYRVSTVEKPAVVSPEATLLVKWAVGLGVSDRTPKQGARVRFSGLVKPAFPNGTVVLQRKIATGWKDVLKKTVTSSTADASAYSMRARIRKNGRYRTLVLGDGAHETGTSRVRRLVVH